MSTRVYGIWNFGDIAWPGVLSNPVLWAALKVEPDGSYSELLRLIPESVDDYNLDPQIITAAKAYPVTSVDKAPKGFNFAPGGIGYCLTDLSGREEIYRKYHGGAYPPWHVGAIPTIAVPKKKKKWYQLW